MALVSKHRGLPIKVCAAEQSWAGRQRAVKLGDLLHLPGALVSRTVRSLSGPRWPEREAFSALELGDAKAPENRLRLWKCTPPGSAEAWDWQSSAARSVRLPSLSGRAVQAAEARDSCHGTREEPQRRPAPARKKRARCSEARPRRWARGAEV